ncbi:sulfatase [Streptomyces sp. TRM68367]|uniref:sulfatase n=1 Tax=Streptomyces sp. TRM68367 TaxID=2758415 RepID=UPI00165B9BF1|nr:sulfatase [Streptomyces sp. TRM68367]MBC9727264.1 sulfatase [Streptomyces sp. TRM68367]
MKAIVVMFDSLNRRHLPPYGAEWVDAPNFRRLADRTATFDTCYAGSMPCIPARREMHTGRYNFLHRGWGPLEPFDDSAPELLKDHGVYTHLATDHPHYWEDGGATYHGRFNSFEFFRGQEGDPWKGQVADPDLPDAIDGPRVAQRPSYRQDRVNRSYMQDELDHPQTLTFDAGLEFLHTNHAEDRWFLQVETFDPHEPFFTYERYHKLYPHDYDGPHFDWPDYRQALETPGQVEHLRLQYTALLSMCDRSLGRVLDAMDELELWDDTLLMVVTDHGYLLGEHGWWGKGVPPWYDETIHTPLFVWDPRSGVRGERRTSLVQTIDFAPTLLDWFVVDIPPDMQGEPLRDVVADDTPVREAGLFGAFGGHVSVTDGRYVYMRAPATPGNRPLLEHTLMPTHMRGRFAPEELRGAELAEPFSFTKGVPTLRVDGWTFMDPHAFGTLLFDLEADPDQQRPLADDDLERRMATLLVQLIRANDAPPSQYERLGLPDTGDVGDEHLAVRRQWAQVEASLDLVHPDDYPRAEPSVHATLRTLVDDPETREVLRRHAPAVVDGGMQRTVGDLTLTDIAAYAIGKLPVHALRSISRDLAVLATERGGKE